MPLLTRYLSKAGVLEGGFPVFSVFGLGLSALFGAHWPLKAALTLESHQLGVIGLFISRSPAGATESDHQGPAFRSELEHCLSYFLAGDLEKAP